MTSPAYSNLKLLATSSGTISAKRLSTLTVTATSTVIPRTNSQPPVQSRSFAPTSSQLPPTLTELPSSSHRASGEFSTDTGESIVAVSSQPNILPSNVLTANKSLELGLAVGLPLAVSAVIAGVLGFWYYMKKRKPKSEKMLYSTNNQFYDLKSFDNPYDKLRPSTSVTLNGVIYEQQKPVVEAKTPVNLRDLPNRLQRRSMQFFKRFSTAVKIDDVNNSISPLFLKRFHLNKPRTPESPELSYKQTGLSLPKDKALPKLPSFLHDISFDNLEKPVEEKSAFIAVKAYAKNLADELTIGVGDKVLVLKTHHDGWCTIRKMSTNEIGVVPRLCLVEVT